MRGVIVGTVLAAFFLGCGGVQAPPTTPNEEPASTPVEVGSILWRDFSPETIQQAEREGKLLMVDAGIEGCTACRNQHEITYQNAEVIRRVNEKYVAVAVDADQQLDLGHRFRPWGWPATVFLKPSGEMVYAVAGSRMPRRFLQILDAVEAGETSGEWADANPAAVEPKTAELDRRCGQAASTLDAIADGSGWGPAPRIVSNLPIEYSLFRLRTRREEHRKEQLLGVGESYAKVLDPAWGGVFIAVREKDFSGPIPEKRLFHEAGALATFASLYALSGEEIWKERVGEVDRYLQEWLRSPKGTYYTTQQDEPVERLPDDMTKADYFALDDAGRRKYGVPRVDDTVYTSEQGDVIRAYLQVYAHLDDEDALQKALQVADVIVRDRKLPGGGLAQTRARSEKSDADVRLRADASDHERLFLGANARFGLAALELYQATFDERWLQVGLEIAEVLQGLEDQKARGFFATTERETDAVLGRIKPFRENVAAERFFRVLSFLRQGEDGGGAYAKIADRTLGYVLAVAKRRGAGNLSLVALATDVALQGPVDVSVVAEDPSAAEIAALREAALGELTANAVLQLEKPGRHAGEKKPVAYVCVGDRCSAAQKDAESLKKTISEFVRASVRSCELN